jgi:hypothetical protein
MRGVAEYAMRGRRQAVVTVLICGVIPIVNLMTPALVGLVCLRHGLTEALKVLVWAVLPLLAWAMIGDITPLILMVGVMALATVLRRAGDWEHALLAAVLVAVAAEMTLRLRPEFMAAIMEQIEAMMASGAQPGDVAAADLQMVLYSLFGLVHMVLAICLLIVARWWQALIYNPGGFREEFHQLRFQPRNAMILALLFMVAGFTVPVLAGWALYFVVPLVFAGLALVHGVMGLKQVSGAWVVALYAMLLFAGQLGLMLLTVAALFDSWYNFRARMRNT